MFFFEKREAALLIISTRLDEVTERVEGISDSMGSLRVDMYTLRDAMMALRVDTMAKLNSILEVLG